MAHKVRPQTGNIDAAVVFGGINMDIWGRPEGKLIPKDSNPGTVALRPGGVGRNIAHDLRLLGLEVSLVAAIGGDVYASAISESCRALGIDLSYAPVFPQLRSSTYLYISDERGEMQLAVSDMDICSALTAEYAARVLPKLQAGAVVVDTNLPEETIRYICENSGIPVYADPVSTAKAVKLLPVLHRLSAIKPNALEAEKLTGEKDPERAARALVEKGVERVFISLGGDGVYAADHSGACHIPCFPARMVNTTGCGDAFMAAIAWAYLEGTDLEGTARAGLAASAIAMESEETINPAMSAEGVRCRMGSCGASSRF